jgi:hypothetical protein
MSGALARLILCPLVAVCLLASFSSVSPAEDDAETAVFGTDGLSAADGHHFTGSYPVSYERFFFGDDPSSGMLFHAFKVDPVAGAYADSLTAMILDLPEGLPADFKTEGAWDEAKLGLLWRALAADQEGAVSEGGDAGGDGGRPWREQAFRSFKDNDSVVTDGAFRHVLSGDKVVRLYCGRDAFLSETDAPAADKRDDPVCRAFFSSVKFVE